jgi:hypothetical protein
MTSSALLGGADVLLVEDDPGDVLLTREAFEDHHLGLQLRTSRWQAVYRPRHLSQWR